MQRLILAAILIACAIPAGAQQPRASGMEAPDVAPVFSLSALAVADSIYARADSAYRKGNHAEAGRLYVEALAAGRWPWAPGMVEYNAACSFALAGKTGEALLYLERAAAAGYRSLDQVVADSDLRSLYSDPRWGWVIEEIRANRDRHRERHANPDRVRLVTSDIDLFWRAYDLAAQEVTREGKQRVFRREYVERGSSGLVDYYRAKVGSIEKLVSFIEEHPGYYAAARESTLRVGGMEAEIRNAYRRLKQLYPEAVFPDVYFVIGRLSSGGTVSPRGLLIGTEMYGVTDATPMEEISLGLRRVVSPINALAHTVAHELIHFQQPPGGGGTLLDAALREGVAVFVGDLILPGGMVPYYRTWGQAHARDVWLAFEREMEGSDWSRWIGNNQAATEEWPADLGYHVGYEIASAYYARAADRGLAIRELLRLEDPRAILRASRYGEQFVR